MIKNKKDLAEIVNESEEESVNKMSLLIEPNLYRDILDFIKKYNGTLEVEDQYGELAKGKATETDTNSQQDFMQLLENYEKMNLEEEKKGKPKPEVKSKPSKKPAKDKTIVCSSCKNAVFDNPKDYRAHVKSGWHICNVKRKMDVKLFIMLFRDWNN